MTANAVNEWGAMLSAMNVSSGGNAINVSNLPQRGDGMRGMRAMLKEVLLDMPTPVVSVVDINKGQRRVKVQDNISKLGRKSTNDHEQERTKTEGTARKIGRPRNSPRALLDGL